MFSSIIGPLFSKPPTNRKAPMMHKRIPRCMFILSRASLSIVENKKLRTLSPLHPQQLWWRYNPHLHLRNGDIQRTYPLNNLHNLWEIKGKTYNNTKLFGQRA